MTQPVVPEPTTPAPAPPPAPTSDRLAVKFKDGTIGTLPRDEAIASVQAGHGVPATNEEYEAAHAQRLQDNGGIMDAYSASAFGAVRGLGAAFGLPTDKLAVDTAKFLGGDKAAERTREVLKDSELVNPLAHQAGELGGMALPALFGEEGALGAVGETAENLGKSALEKLAMGGAEAAEGASNAFLPRALAKAIPMATRGAAEGAQLGAVDAINEDAIENQPLTGEQLFAASLKGAAGGAIGGAVIGGAGEGASTAAKSLREAMGNVDVGMSGHLANAAEDQGARALFHSADQATMRKLEALPGGTRGAARQLLDDGIYAPGDTVEHLAPKVAQRKEELGSQLGEIIDNADEAKAEGPNVKSIVSTIRKKILPDLESAPSLYGSEIRRVNDVIADIEAAAGKNAVTEHIPVELENSTALARRAPEGYPEAANDNAIPGPNTVTTGGDRLKFRQAQKLRGLIDKKIRDFAPMPGAPPNTAQDTLKAIRGIIEDHIESAMDQADGKIGRDVGADYRAKKLAFRRYAVADTALEKSVTRVNSNRNFKPTSYLAGAAAVSHYGILGAAATAAHEIVRERGNATAAVYLDKLSKMAAIKRQSATVADDVTTGLRKFFSGEAKAEQVPRLDAKKLDLIRQHLTDANAQHADLTGRLGDLPNHAPKVAQQLALTHMRAVAYLASKMPKPLPSANTMQPQLSKKRYAPQDMLAFSRAHQAITDPSSIPRLLGSGQLTREHVEALKTVYPAMYEDLQKLVMQKAMLSKKPASYSQRIALSLLFGNPLDATMDPRFIQDIQATYAANPEPQSQGAQAPKRPLKLSGALTDEHPNSEATPKG